MPEDGLVRAHVALIEAVGASVGGWDWFATLTFASEVRPDRADRMWNRWIHRLNRRLFGVRYHRSGAGCVWARASEHQRRGALHFHALLGSADSKLRGQGSRGRTTAMADWESDGRWRDPSPVPRSYRRNGMARIDPFDSGRNAAAYAAKATAARYAGRGGQVDFGGPILVGSVRAAQVGNDR